MGEIIVFVLLFGVYFFPALIASRRKHHNQGAIFLLNLLLGWTVLGWLIALIWSATSSAPQVTYLVQAPPPPTNPAPSPNPPASQG